MYYKNLPRRMDRLPLNDSDRYSVVYHPHSLVIVQEFVEGLGLTAMIDGVLYTTTIDMPLARTIDLVDLVDQFMAKCR